MSFTGFAVQSRAVVCILMATVVIAGGCNKDDSVNTSVDLVTPFHGISKADHTGTISEPDSDDWRPLSN